MDRDRIGVRLGDDARRRSQFAQTRASHDADSLSSFRKNDLRHNAHRSTLATSCAISSNFARTSSKVIFSFWPMALVYSAGVGYASVFCGRVRSANMRTGNYSATVPRCRTKELLLHSVPARASLQRLVATSHVNNPSRDQCILENRFIYALAPCRHSSRHSSTVGAVLGLPRGRPR